jgi:histidinol-phosphate aminotransferase
MKDIAKLVRPSIAALAPYSCARDEYKGSEGVFLDANENPFGAINRYPDPMQTALKQRIAQIKNIAVRSIFLGNGSDEVIDLAYRIFCEPKRDKALIFTPTYGMYEVSANINAVEVIKIPLNADFQIDMQQTKPYLQDKNLKLIFICSPNNPTGNLMQTADIEYIINHFDGIVLLDEAYIDFCPQPSFSARLAEFPNLIVMQTLSKAWAAAGLRLGIACANENILTFFNKVKPPYNISIVNQRQALEVLADEQTFWHRREIILQEKMRVENELRKLPLVQKVYPSDANFLLVQVDDACALYNRLIANKIIVRNRHSVAHNCLRITIGSPQENEKLLTLLRNF